MKKFALVAALALATMVTPVLAQTESAPAQTSTQAPAAAGTLTVDSTMPELIGNAAAKAVLERNLGSDLVNNPQLQSAPISLRGLASYIPSLTEDKLTQINTELAAIH